MYVQNIGTLGLKMKG